MIDALGLTIIRLELIILNRPCRRDAAMVFNFAEVLFAQTEQRCAIEFGIATDVVIRMRMQLCAIDVAPKFLGVVATFHVHCARIPVLLLAPYERAAFDQENAFATRSQLVRQRPATRS